LLKVLVSTSTCKASAGQDIGTVSIQPVGAVEFSSDDHGSPPAGSQASSCAVSRRTSIGPYLRSAGDDTGHVSTSESHENSIVRGKQPCGAEILNFEHLKLQLDKLTGQNKEKPRQSDAENGNSTISPSPSCGSFSSHTAPVNLPGVSSWPSGLDRTPSIESDVVSPADGGVGSMRSATDNTVALTCKYAGVEQKPPMLDPICGASSVALTLGDLLAPRVGGQQMKPECLVASHHHQQHHHHLGHQHQRDTASQEPTVVGICPPSAAHSQPLNAGTTSGAFQLPGYSCDHAQPPAAHFSDWQQQVLLLQQQQQLLMMQAQHPLITQCQQMLRLQQQLQQHQQAMRLVYATVLQSQHKPDMMQNTPASPLLAANAVTPQYQQWQTELTKLLTESGLSSEKSCELVQQLQRIMMPASSLPAHVPGAPVSQLLSGSGGSFDPLSLLHSRLPVLSHFHAGGLPWPFLMSWSNVQVAYAQLVQLLARPNPLITPELLESMFAQLPPPLDLSALGFPIPGAMFESFYGKYLELLAMQISQLPVTPVQLTPPPASVHGFFGSSDSCSVYSSKLVGEEVSNVKNTQYPVVFDSRQLGTPTKAVRASYAGVGGSCVAQNCSVHRGASLDSESGDVPGAMAFAIPRSTISSSRHQNVSTGNGAGKVLGGAMPRKSVDCPQGLADLDMALKEKLRPRTTKAVTQAVPEYTKTSTSAVVSTGIGFASSAPSQSAVVSVTSDVERPIVTVVSALSGSTVMAVRNTPLVTHDASAVPKLHGTSAASAAKCAPAVPSVVKKPPISVVHETAVCKACDVATVIAAVSGPRTASAVSGSVHVHEVSRDVIVKPTNSSMSVNITTGLVPLVGAAKSSSYLTVVSLPLLSTATSDINRQHVSDSAIAATTTHLAQKHLQKKMSVTDQESVSVIDVATRQAHSVMSVSSQFFNARFFFSIPDRGARSIVMSMSVCRCVFVCPRSYVWNYTSDLHQIFCACYL